MMKKIMKLFVIVAAAAMTLASCQKPEIENVQPQEFEYKFLIGNADTKATVGEACVEWELGDKVGTYNSKSNNKFSSVTALTPATLSVYAPSNGNSAGLEENEVMYFYYPYASGTEVQKTSVAMSIPAVQDGDDDMPMVSLPVTVTSATTEEQNEYAGEIKFANLGSVIEFNVYTVTDAYASEVVKSVTFEADQALAGAFTFDLTSVDYSDESTLTIADYTETTVVVNAASDLEVGTKEDPAIVRMVVAPGTYAGSIIVKTDAATYTFPISSAKEFKRSAVKPLGLNLRENVREENTSSEPEEVTATLTFDDAAKRIVSTTTQQVWVENDITLTYNKAGYNNNLAEYEKPVRFYANTTITLEAPGNIEAIEFACNTSAYATALHQAISGSSVNDKMVTVTLDGSSPTVTYTMAAQVRMDALTVKYAKADPTAPSITAENVTGVSARGDEAAKLTYEIANLEYSDLTVTCDGTVVTSASKGEDGVINYSVSANSTTSARDGLITISNGTLTKEVKVSQLAPVFTVSRNDIELGATADSQTTVTVTSDFDWVLSMEGNGYAVTPTSYTWAEGGKEKVTIQATADRTEEGVADLGTITFVNSTTGQELTINVTQATSYVAEGGGNEETATLSFADKAQRTTFTSSQQIWEQNGIKLINNKASSTNAVADYAKPARFYAGSNLEVTAPGAISTIVFDANSSSYATAMKNSIGTVSGATVTVSSDKVTVTFTDSVDSFVIAKLTAQVRMDSITVTYQN